ncbi:hypothetical protein D0Y50_04310 [Salinimonas sediminis]|uniref:Uncharacterized protein n=1 Tax=Salinimonas sediminis TaxID=2303538 RepID=A0A346NJF4_9ALTE|nr:hypothetical protein D0Y50_04310 [Salinimonas sediminis]
MDNFIDEECYTNGMCNSVRESRKGNYLRISSLHRMRRAKMERAYRDLKQDDFNCNGWLRRMLKI